MPRRQMTKRGSRLRACRGISVVMILVFFLVVPWASATPVGGVREPVLPLVAEAPERAEWSVRFYRDFGANWQDSEVWAEEQAEDGNESGRDRQVRSIEISKDVRWRTWRLRTIFSDGYGDEEWLYRGQHVAERAGGVGHYVVGVEGSESRQITELDFPELQWVEMEHYRGRRSFRGRDVYVFAVAYDDKRLTAWEERMLRLAREGNPEMTPSMAWQPVVDEVVLYVDVEAQLPLLYNDGRTIHLYAFTEPMTPRLQVPMEIADFLHRREESIGRRLTPPTAPGSP